MIFYTEYMCPLQELRMKWGKECDKCEWFNIHPDVKGCPFNGMNVGQTREIIGLKKKINSSEWKIKSLESDIEYYKRMVPYLIGLYQIDGRERVEKEETRVKNMKAKMEAERARKRG